MVEVGWDLRSAGSAEVSQVKAAQPNEGEAGMTADCAERYM